MPFVRDRRLRDVLSTIISEFSDVNPQHPHGSSSRAELDDCAFQACTRDDRDADDATRLSGCL